MNPIILLLVNVIDLYSLAVIIWAILGMLISFKVVNRSHPFVYKVDEVLTRLVDPALKPIRKYLPDLGGIDISPIILLLLLNFLKHSLVYYF